MLNREKRDRAAVDFYDQLAPGWEAKYQTRSFVGRSIAMLSLLDTGKMKGERWLDAGCGTGPLSRRLASFGCLVVAVDASFKMIDHARMLTQDLSLEDSISYSTIETITRLPYGDASFDGIVCSSVIEYLPDPGACLSEFHRVLRPEGTVLLSFANRTSVVRQLRRLAFVATKKLGSKLLAPYMEYSVNEYSRAQAFDALRNHGFCPTQANFAGTFLPKLVDQLSFIGNLINVRAIKSRNVVSKEKFSTGDSDYGHKSCNVAPDLYQSIDISTKLESCLMIISCGSSKPAPQIRAVN